MSKHNLTALEKMLQLADPGGIRPQKKQVAIDTIDQFRSIDANKITLSSFYNREPHAFSDEEFEQLKNSIKANGQDEPVVVRKVEDGHLELISGHRRLEACRQLSIPVKYVLREVPNRDLAELIKHRENDERTDWSAWERAHLYKQWIDRKMYKNQSEVAKAINKTRAYISSLFALHEIPDEIVSVVEDKRQIQISHARKYASLKKHPTWKKILHDRLKNLKETQSDREKLDYLLAAPRKKATGQKSTMKAVRTADGQTLAEANSRNRSIRVSKDLPPEFFRYITDTLPLMFEDWRRKNSGK